MEENKNPNYPEREWRKVFRVLDFSSLDGKPVSEIINFIVNETKGLEGAIFSFSRFGYETEEMYISYWEKRTDKEIASFDEQKTKKDATKRKKDQKVIDRLKKDYPDLFKII